jgi:hypothetical protein
MNPTIANGKNSAIAAFTLLEAMVVSGTLLLVIGSMIACNLWGVSMSYRQQIWLNASDDAAQALGKLMTDIRSGASNYVGSYSGTNVWQSSNAPGVPGFTICGGAVWQAGNAMVCYVGTTNGGTNIPWVLYYYDTVHSNLYRTNYTGSNYGDFKMVTINDLMTNNIYGSNIFAEYDYLGNQITSNTIAQPIIQVCLAFTKLQNPQIVIAPGGPVDFYQIVATIASRNKQ